MGMIDLFWNLSQERRIGEAQMDSRTTTSSLTQVQAQVDRLQATVDRLTLLNQAIWELLGAKQGLTDNQLANKVHEIDLRDGVVDGRLNPALTPCHQCQRPNRADRQLCLYCGTKLGR